MKDVDSGKVEPRTRRRVMVVDDDEVVRVLLGRSLTRAGFEVILAEHGARAMELIVERPPDVLVVDLIMPFVDGIGLLRWLRDDAHLRLPCIAVTSAREDLTDEARQAGCCAVIAKPFEVEDVIALLESLLPQVPA